LEQLQQAAGPGEMKAHMMMSLEMAALKSGFVLTKEGGGGATGREWLRSKDKKLFEDIVNRRKDAPLSAFDYGYFSNSERSELNPLYS
jgi:hypothetical protein